MGHCESDRRCFHVWSCELHMGIQNSVWSVPLNSLSLSWKGGQQLASWCSQSVDSNYFLVWLKCLLSTRQWLFSSSEIPLAPICCYTIETQFVTFTSEVAWIIIIAQTGSKVCSSDISESEGGICFVWAVNCHFPSPLAMEDFLGHHFRDASLISWSDRRRPCPLWRAAIRIRHGRAPVLVTGVRMQEHDSAFGRIMFLF